MPVSGIIIECGATPEIAPRYSAESFCGLGEYARVILRDEEGKEKVIFTGSKFSEEHYQQRIASEDSSKPRKGREPVPSV